MQHPLDAVQAITKSRFDSVKRDVDLVIEDAVKHKDPEIALNYGAKLHESGQALWIAIASLTYEMRQRWNKEFKSDDDFITVASARWNKAPETIRRYVEIWEWVIQKPGHEISRLLALLSKPMQGLWYIKQAAREGQISESTWSEIARAPDISTLREIGKRARGGDVGRAKDALKIMLESDGTIKARRKGAYEVVGYLNLKEDSPVVQAAVERIQNRAGLFRR